MSPVRYVLGKLLSHIVCSNQGRRAELNILHIIVNNTIDISIRSMLGMKQ